MSANIKATVTFATGLSLLQIARAAHVACLYNLGSSQHSSQICIVTKVEYKPNLILQVFLFITPAYSCMLLISYNQARSQWCLRVARKHLSKKRRSYARHPTRPAACTTLPNNIRLIKQPFANFRYSKLARLASQYASASCFSVHEMQRKRPAENQPTILASFAQAAKWRTTPQWPQTSIHEALSKSQIHLRTELPPLRMHYMYFQNFRGAAPDPTEGFTAPPQLPSWNFTSANPLKTHPTTCLIMVFTVWLVISKTNERLKADS